MFMKRLKHNQQRSKLHPNGQVNSATVVAAAADATQTLANSQLITEAQQQQQQVITTTDLISSSRLTSTSATATTNKTETSLLAKHPRDANSILNQAKAQSSQHLQPRAILPKQQLPTTYLVPVNSIQQNGQTILQPANQVSLETIGNYRLIFPKSTNVNTQTSLLLPQYNSPTIQKIPIITSFPIGEANNSSLNTSAIYSTFQAFPSITSPLVNAALPQFSAQDSTHTIQYDTTTASTSNLNPDLNPEPAATTSQIPVETVPNPPDTIFTETTEELDGVEIEVVECPSLKRPLSSLETAELSQPNESNEELFPDYLNVTQKDQVHIHSLDCLVNVTCGQFTTRQLLNDHMKKTHGVLPFRCFLDNCGLSFNDSSKLYVHVITTHFNLSAFHCCFCGHSEEIYKALHTHVVMCHEQGHFSCTFANSCSFTGINRNQVVEHYSQTHLGVQASSGTSEPLKRPRRLPNSKVCFRCKWDQCRYRTYSAPNAIKHVIGIHFKLATLFGDQQVEDLGDPMLYVALERNYLRNYRNF